MSYLKFDKTVMINLEESLTREVLRTNLSFIADYHTFTNPKNIKNGKRKN